MSWMTVKADVSCCKVALSNGLGNEHWCDRCHFSLLNELEPEAREWRFNLLARHSALIPSSVSLFESLHGFRVLSLFSQCSIFLLLLLCLFVKLCGGKRFHIFTNPVKCVVWLLTFVLRRTSLPSSLLQLKCTGQTQKFPHLYTDYHYIWKQHSILWSLPIFVNMRTCRSYTPAYILLPALLLVLKQHDNID